MLSQSHSIASSTLKKNPRVLLDLQLHALGCESIKAFLCPELRELLCFIPRAGCRLLYGNLERSAQLIFEPQSNILPLTADRLGLFHQLTEIKLLLHALSVLLSPHFSATERVSPCWLFLLDTLLPLLFSQVITIFFSSGLISCLQSLSFVTNISLSMARWYLNHLWCLDSNCILILHTALRAAGCYWFSSHHYIFFPRLLPFHAFPRLLTKVTVSG